MTMLMMIHVIVVRIQIVICKIRTQRLIIICKHVSLNFMAVEALLTALVLFAEAEHAEPPEGNEEGNDDEEDGATCSTDCDWDDVVIFLRGCVVVRVAISTRTICCSCSSCGSFGR